MDGYEYGMRVYLVPNSENPLGYGFDRNYWHIQLLVSKARQEVAEQFNITLLLIEQEER
ncbi:hypothetical protein [Legionella sp. 16cNR16C]|uniref:hypothetical protein n=1 Tax=Legionella sp. 16cNR16C TaxID=2905656 RepID=UPI001E62C545|nr:hypothetical protein [Legionella sp. 16cNR16C]MCE3043967.1 hypothetical protein [Legionella sp. 16cNR16C]